MYYITHVESLAAVNHPVFSLRRVTIDIYPVFVFRRFTFTFTFTTGAFRHDNIINPHTRQRMTDIAVMTKTGESVDKATINCRPPCWTPDKLSKNFRLIVLLPIFADFAYWDRR